MLKYFFKRWANAAHFESLGFFGESFLGADWIWSFKFLCLTRQVSTPWPCFAAPASDGCWTPRAPPAAGWDLQQCRFQGVTPVGTQPWERSGRCQCNSGCNLTLSNSRAVQMVLSKWETRIPAHKSVWGEVKLFMLLELKVFPATSYLVCTHSSRITTPLKEGKSPAENTDTHSSFPLNLPSFLFIF